ncbi:Sodium/hydrogen exchanger [Exidia glandulosa HHB12029]|uniref:Sodium/hydrogen exchanger n=1 Tax=Exidia glandulosa HHB12029 TaxID=1314781 RepID=A0A165EYJ4_EXIGL|nr:Sodium/hydrogen exchanger [Exidia glandulosa HHB12029]
MAGAHVEYHEPGAVDLLVLGSFIYLLNISRWLADRILYAGLLGEILVGIVFGPPLADILPAEWQQTFLTLGYLGLVLIVFEGGLDFEPALFLGNALISILVAFTGITMPIALSSALLGAGFSYPSLEAFAAGAALSSTSLGTTFFVLQATSKGDKTLNLVKTRIGTILVAAALIDDVVGLIMLSVLSSLGTDGATSSESLGWTIGRPILVALLMTAVLPLVFFLLWRMTVFRATMSSPHVCVFCIVALLSGFVAVAFWAGTSVLLGAFLAGICLSLLAGQPVVAAFSQYIRPLQDYLLAPLFFASIGYSIPFLDLFTGKRIWRGLLYSLLMTIAKLSAGVWPAAWSRRRSALAPALFVGTALVARGEIGVLIATVANTSPKHVLGEEAYLEAIWAILVCTAVGPPVVGVIVRRYGKAIAEGPWGFAPGETKARLEHPAEDVVLEPVSALDSTTV